MNFLLEIEKTETINSENFGDMLLFGGQIVLIGMVTVFAVLGLIWACLTVFKMVFHDLPSKKSEAKVSKEEAPRVVDEPVAYASDDEEIVAVIAAAIAAAESETSGVKFRVVSFRRR